MPDLLPWGPAAPIDAGSWVSAVATVTADSTPHVKGAWTEVIAATPVPIDLLDITIFGVSAASNSHAMLIDIGIGPSGNETPVIENVNASCARAIGHDNTPLGARNIFPFFLPAGTRIAVRCQSSTSGKTASVLIVAMPAAGRIVPGRRCVTLGADTAASRGTVPNMSGSSSYLHTQLTASCPINARWAVVSVGTTGTAQFDTSVLFVVGVGGSGSEVVVTPGVTFISNTSEGCAGGGALMPVDIPAGSRVTVGTLRTFGGTNPYSVCLHLID